jgi:hypothetical protein
MNRKHTDPVVESDGDARERDAFNAAFRELGLRWHWDAATFRDLKDIADDGERIRTYLETRAPHLLKAYDAAFLADAVRAVKDERAHAYAGPRPSRHSECADFATAQTGF